MTEIETCTQCGSERPAHSAKGMCPRCLLQQVLDSEAPPAAKDRGRGSDVMAALASTIGEAPRVLLRDSATNEATAPLVLANSPEMPARESGPSGCSSSARSPAAAWAPS